MFSKEPNSSKVCLVHLVERMKTRGMTLLDIQFMTEHLRRFGAIEIPREEYEERVREAITLECSFL